MNHLHLVQHLVYISSTFVPTTTRGSDTEGLFSTGGDGPRPVVPVLSCSGLTWTHDHCYREVFPSGQSLRTEVSPQRIQRLLRVGVFRSYCFKFLTILDFSGGRARLEGSPTGGLGSELEVSSGWFQTQGRPAPSVLLRVLRFLGRPASHDAIG